MVSASVAVARSTVKSPDDSSVSTNACDASLAILVHDDHAQRPRAPALCPEKTKPNSTATTTGQTNVKNQARLDAQQDAQIFGR